MKICLSCGNGFISNSWVCPVCGYEPRRDGGIVVHAPQVAESGAGFKAEYFGELFDVEARNFWFRARSELILWALGKYKSELESMLEVGCGTGFVLSSISRDRPEIALSGCEIFLAGLRYAAERVPHAQLMQMDARHVPFKEEFEAVGAFDVIEHIEQDEVVLTELFKALKPGGLLLLTVPQHPWLWSVTDDHACHVRRYTRRELRDKTQRAGFQIVRSTSFVSLLLPVMLVSRHRKVASRVEMDLGPEPSRGAELDLPKGLNRALYCVMKLEVTLIRMGLNFWMGGSRLMVARKPL